MAHMPISPGNTIVLLQAQDFLVEARRLKPGLERSAFREFAKVFRELAKVESNLNPSTVIAGRTRSKHR